MIAKAPWNAAVAVPCLTPIVLLTRMRSENDEPETGRIVIEGDGAARNGQGLWVASAQVYSSCIQIVFSSVYCSCAQTDLSRPAKPDCL